MTDIDEALALVRARIAAACHRTGRDPETVVLIGATKEVPVPILVAARAAGLEHFGENRAKDLEAKAEAVPATWHYLGKLQTGTARKVADHADVVHSAEPGGGLEALARRAASAGRSIACLAQVDFTGRRQGVAPEALERFLAAVAGMDGLRVVGLMTVPPPTPRPEGARPYFARLRDLLDSFLGRWPGLRELSMGMSADFEIAVEEGATMVRVGTALFGDRRRADADPGTGAPRPG
jgi:pyridoxal phosphate enzyme (YggS family)